MKYKYLFGPVPSRRLGISLGIDLIPPKICTFDCAYCESGKTTNLTNERKNYVSPDSVISELRDFLNKNPKLDFITFSGNGEPTLNLGIDKIISFIKENYPQYKVALITNGTLLHDNQLRKELYNLDLIMPSLDAVSKDVISLLNNPVENFDISLYIDGLISFSKEFSGDYWLECFLAEGINDSEEELSLIKEAVLKINPTRFQLNSLDRPPVESFIKPISIEKMQKIADFFKPLPVEIIAKYKDYNSDFSVSHSDITASILSLIQRRPCTLDDICFSLGITTMEANKYLRILEEEDKIISVFEKRGYFYKLKS